MSIKWDNFEEVGGSAVDSPDEMIKFEIVGDSVEGRYINSYKPDNAESMIYVIEQEDGNTVGIWGSTVIDTKFKSIAKGKMVAIEYLGKTKSKTGREYKDFKVGQGIDVVGDEKGDE